MCDSGERGWLERMGEGGNHPKSAKLYRITGKGREVLSIVREQLRELRDEIEPGQSLDR